MIVMPPMPPEQTASWLGVLDLYDHLGKGWTLIGGQLVHLYCAERGQFPVRPTNARRRCDRCEGRPEHVAYVTSALTGIGFTSAGISAEGRQHRWVRGQASIDVLLPDGVGAAGQRTPGRYRQPDAANGRRDPGAAAQRGRGGDRRRPGRKRLAAKPRRRAVVKAAAHGNAGDPGGARHRRDFVVLAGLVITADFANEQLTRKDRQRLRLIVTAIKNDRELLLEIPGATAVIERLKVAAKLDT